MNVLYQIFKPLFNYKVNYELVETFSRIDGSPAHPITRALIYVTFNKEPRFELTIGTSDQYKNIYYISNMRTDIIERLQWRNLIKVNCKLKKK